MSCMIVNSSMTLKFFHNIAEFQDKLPVLFNLLQTHLGHGPRFVRLLDMLQFVLFVNFHTETSLAEEYI